MKFNSLRFFLLSGLLVILCSDFGEAAVAIGFYTDPAHPGKCYISSQLILAEGEQGQDPDSCGQYHCNDGKQGLTELHSCIAIAPPQNCKWTNAVDKKAAYPLCCLSNFQCDDSKDEEQAQQLQENLKQQFLKQVNSN